jgi:DNA phosphorothioation-associated putative methyltransferase
VADIQYQENRELLDSLMEAVAGLGRLPEPDEFGRFEGVASRFGSLKRAFAVVVHITGGDEWDQIAKRCAEDMLVYLALARFRQRPAFSQLPRTLQLDIKVFFHAYTKACAQADELLFRAGKAELVDAACKRSPIG